MVQAEITREIKVGRLRVTAEEIRQVREKLLLDELLTDEDVALLDAILSRFLYARA